MRSPLLNVIPRLFVLGSRPSPTCPTPTPCYVFHSLWHLHYWNVTITSLWHCRSGHFGICLLGLQCLWGNPCSEGPPASMPEGLCSDTWHFPPALTASQTWSGGVLCLLCGFSVSPMCRCGRGPELQSGSGTATAGVELRFIADRGTCTLTRSASCSGQDLSCCTTLWDWEEST